MGSAKAAGSISVPGWMTGGAFTALLFDLGVFALVVGATALILIALAHQSIRSHRSRTTETTKREENT